MAKLKAEVASRRRGNLKSFSVLMVLVLVVALGAAIVPASPVQANGTNYYVRTDGNDANDGSADDAAHAWLTIEHASDNVSTGDTINVAAGTYDEQVVIDKSLTLEGAGDTTIVKPSSAAKLTTILDGQNPYGVTKQIAGIIVANDATSVTVKNLKVDGGTVIACPAGANYVTGIFYRETGGTIDTVTVDNMMVGVADASGYGISLSSVTNTVSVEVKGSTIANFDKNGLDACGSKLTANIHDNIVTGRGQIGDEVQNGIVVAQATEGTVNHNIISDIYYTGGPWSAWGIAFHCSDGSANNNTITDCGVGICVESGDLSAEGNNVTGTGMIGLHAQTYKEETGTWTVSFVNNTVAGSKFWGIGVGWQTKTHPEMSLTVTLDDNHLTGGLGDGIYIGDSYTDAVGQIIVTIENNDIRDWAHGISIRDNNVSLDTVSATITGNTIQNNAGAVDSGIHIESDIDATKVQVHFNNIVRNTGTGVYGIYNGGTGILDAENNWWGCNGGPGAAGCDTVSAANVVYDPWLQLNISANPSSIAASPTDSSTITADMTKNSADQDTSAQGNIPNGTNVLFSTDRGTLGSSSDTKQTTNGIATATLTGEASTEDVVATVSATVNNASPSTTVTFVGMAAPVEESKSQDVTGDSGTIPAGDSPTGGTVTVSGSGMNTTVTTTKYTGNPGGSTSGFQASGNYYDVHLSNATGVSSLVVDFCPATASTVIYFWNCTSWVAASNQSYAGGCITVTITPTTTPTLSQLTGTAFASGIPPTPAPPVAPTPPPSLDGSTGGPSPARMTSPELKLKYLNINPQQASANQPVTISTNVVNRGGMAGSTNVILKINGKVEESRMVSVSPGAAHPVKFTVYRSQPGTYNVNVGGQQSSFTILGAAGGTAGSPVSGTLIAVILIIGVLLIAGVVLLFRRLA